MSLLRDRLRLVSLDYDLREVRVLFLKDYPRLPLPGGLVEARRGDEMDLPRWQARLLAEAGVVEVRERLPDINDINMYHYREKRGRAANQLQPLPEDFYLRVSEFIERLNEAIRENPSSTLIRDRETAEKNTIDLAETRLSKLIRLAQAESGELKERMTLEERIIFDVIREIIGDWRGYVEKAARGERP